MNFSNEDTHFGVHNNLSKGVRANATKLIRKYFDRLVDRQLAEFYEVPVPTVLFNENSQTLEVVEGAEESENALMKLWFVADSRAQAQKNIYQSAGSTASYEFIRNSHSRLRISKPARVFTTISANEDDSPYERMRSLRRTSEGKEITGGYGIKYAAEVLVGEVILIEPEFSAANPDTVVQDIVKSGFIRRSD